MRLEQEIRERLKFWQGMLAVSQIGAAANHAEVFANLPQALQHYAIEQMKFPPELRHHFAHLQEKSLGVIIDTLKWVLGEDK